MTMEKVGAQESSAVLAASKIDVTVMPRQRTKDTAAQASPEMEPTAINTNASIVPVWRTAPMQRTILEN